MAIVENLWENPVVCFFATLGKDVLAPEFLDVLFVAESWKRSENVFTAINSYDQGLNLYPVRKVWIGTLGGTVLANLLEHEKWTISFVTSVT